MEAGASTASSPSTSPDNSRFSFPTPPASSLALHQQHHCSPQKPVRSQPNSHPYAIKTTSTTLLSRSSSTSSQLSLTRIWTETQFQGHGLRNNLLLSGGGRHQLREGRWIR
ncbi:hypothetical protein CPC08DRAFT_716209 [Agrocybe pediades]|nr:hypothetical protein CPC08DRAFT_716209 [Agrocybe pediades]